MKADGESVESMAAPRLGGLAAKAALAAVLMAVIAAAAVPAPSDGAASGTCGDGLEWELDDEGVLTISGEGYMEDYGECGPWGDGVTKVVAGDGVRSIGNHAFSRCSSLASASMPAAESIGGNAFSRCSSLESVEIPAATSIGHQAFDECTSIVSASMPAAESIGDLAFYGCSSLESASMPAAESIGNLAFYDCSSLREVLIPSSTETIGRDAFSGITFLGPDGEELEHDASSLRGHLYLGDGDGTLGRSEREGTCGERLYWSLSADGALTIAGEGYMRDYGECGPWGVGVKRVVAGDGVRSIGNHAFHECTSLVSVSMPAAVSIGYEAFYDCSSLESASMPAAESIGEWAFHECTSLASASMPSAVSIGERAFYRCSSLESASMPAAESIGGWAFHGTSLVSASMPAAVSIGDNAFSGCSSLREVLIPSSVETIGEDAFRGIRFLGPDGEELDQDAESLRGHVCFGEGGGVLECFDSEGYCGDGLRWKIDLDGVLTITGEGYMYDYAEAGRGPWGTMVKEVVAGEGVRSVGILAFRGCESLVSASLPGAESIGGAAFSRCYALESVSMPAATSIGIQAFYYCGSLESVDMPSTTSIGYGAFYECLSLESVSMPSAITIGNTAFYYCTSLESVCLPYTLVSLGDRAFYGLTFLDEGGRTLSQDAGSLRGYAYVGSGDGELKRLPFAQDGVGYQVCGEGLAVAVGWYGEPSGLKIPDEVQYNGKGYVPVAIADGAFAGCGTLGTISIGSAVAAIGEGALDAPMLRSIEVPADNAAYSSIAGVLYDKDASVLLKFPASKQRLVIPGTVTEIAPFAFENAGAALKAEQGGGDVSYLRYVSVPGSVVSIGEGAFRGSTLEVLKLADGTTKIGAEAFSGCSALSYVVFCDTLEEAGEGAFDGCAFLGEDGEPMEFGIGAVSGHKFTLTDASTLGMYVPAPGGTISSGGIAYKITGSGEDKAVYACRLADASLTEIDVPAFVRYLGFDWEVTSVGAKAFYGNGSITGATVAVDVGSKSFANCRGLESVTLAGAGKVGPYAFFGCTSLASADIGSVSALGESSFSGCRSLADVDLSKVVTVGKHAFYNCALTRADLSSAEAIGYGAFTGNDLREVAFSPGLESVDPKAFFRYSFYGADGAKLPVSASNLAGKAFEGSGKVLAQAY